MTVLPTIYGYEYFKREVQFLTGIDLSCYKESQMKRRIDTLIAKRGIEGYDKYVSAIRTDRGVLEEFVAYITINVSQFYRDPDQWKVMEEKAIPELIARFGKRLKIWSAACSTGDEPYSLVMAMSRYIPLSDIRIYATDLDRQVIEKAKAGVYSDKSIVTVPADLRRRYFRLVDGDYRISEEIKACVEFREHNLLKDAYPTGCHMIVCRNVLIYFTELAKDQVFRKYFTSLVSGGLLFIGSSEQIMNHKEIGYLRKNAFYYQKP
ncbi:MAG: protein-glutamate O-methyltransferase CheR [Lachnospiraceae bacterium]|nr:protein-glutamate O-methyltransferase CheR [uncultured Acetatifactor sp.]MCI8287077.1 protein-glutamate O-methyltransferase CheR [Lachnospiraceae bacterium]